MLKKRLLTISCLMPLAVAGVLWLPAVAMLEVMAVVLMLAAWEWASLCGWTSSQVAVFVVFVGGFLLTAVTWLPAICLLTLAAVWWLFAAWQCQRYPKFPGIQANQPGWWHAIIGFAVLVPCGVAVLVLHAYGSSVLLSVLALVWLADIAGYVAGRTWGKHKIMPVLSPGKTWQGFAGQVVALGIAAVGLSMIWPRFSLLPNLVVAGIVLVSALLGDMYESMLKRAFGVKESGTLLPGHGGILDRIDSMTAALPCVALFLIHSLGPVSLSSIWGVITQH